MLITKNTKFSEIIFKNYHLIPIISRFGINFGFGDKSVEQVCAQYNIQTDFFIEIVNTFKDKKDKSSYEGLKNMPLSLTVNYLLKSHHYYNKVKLPNIERLIERLEWSGENAETNKSVLKKFFSQYLKELKEHTGYEEREIYPYVLELERNYNAPSADAAFMQKMERKSINDYADTHDAINPALLDLKNIIIKYLQPSNNKELTETILTEVFKLEEDMNDHTKLEDHVVIPVAIMMENELKKRS